MVNLKKLYNDPNNPGGFAGVEQLYIQAKKSDPSVTKNEIKTFLEANRTYTLHKPRRLKFKREKTIPAGYMTDVQVDLGDFQKLVKQNKKNRYLLVGIDVLSRTIFLAPTKSKSSNDMIEAFEILFKQMPCLPSRIFSDRGLEFDSKEMKKYFESKDVLKFSAQSSVIKAALAERSIRTIKQRLYRYFSEKNTLNWVDVIEKIRHALNNTICRTTGLKPVQINFKNAQVLWKKLYGPLFKNTFKKPRYTVNDVVRVAKQKSVFDKGYLPNFSDKLYKINKIKKGFPDTYELEDAFDQTKKMDGKYYEEEFAKTRLDKNTTYRIEQIYKNRFKNGIKEYLVKFVGYPEKEWIKESDFA